MASTTTTLMQNLTEGPIAAVAQEVMVLGVFVVSFLLWKHLRPNGSGRQTAAKVPKVTVDASANKRSVDAVCVDPSRGEDPVRQRQIRAQVRASEQQMMKHLEQREFTRALNLYRSVEREGRDHHFSEELFSSFIQSAIRVGKVDVVERMLRAMKRGGVPPSLKFWQTVLKMLSSRKHFTACLSAHSIYGNKIPTDKIVLSCLINAALETGANDRASLLLERYQNAEIDAKDHVLFFRTYVGLGDIDKAEAVFKKLGEQTTTLMLNLLLLTCVNAKQPERAERFLRDARTLDAKTQNRICDVVSYNTVIKGFAQAGMPAKCFECLQEMNDHKVDPDDITFGTILDACIVDNDMDAATQILNFLMDDDRPLETVMCTLFIKGLVRANCLTKAVELYEEMKRRETSSPDIVTYSVLIKALVDQHELDRALKLVEDMKAGGLTPDDIVLTHLLEGCRHAGDHALGKRLFSEMVEAGVKPSEFTLVTMLKLHGRCGAHKEAYDLVANWDTFHQSKPSVIHFTCLMSGCLRTKNYDQAWSAYELMLAKGITPDEVSVSTLLPGMVAAQKWDRVLTLVTMALKGTPPVNIPAETLNNALSQILSVGGMAKQAEQLQNLMQGAGVNMTARNAKRLM